MPYLVQIPKDRSLEEIFNRYLKKVGENDNFLFYQGVVEAVIPLNISWPEALEVFREIKVEGGYKRLPRTWLEDGREVPACKPTLLISPKRNRILTIRLSDEEYELLKEDAYSEGWDVSSWARQLVMNLVWEYLEREKFKEARRRIEEEEC